MSLTYAFDIARSSQPANDDATAELAVKYPLLYQVSKDGRTHYVLGHIHSVPLEAMPNYVTETISKCSVLLSEGLVDLPKEAKAKLVHEEPTKNSFINLIDDLILQRLKADLRPILAIRGITESALENISGTLLYQLFDANVKRRMVQALPAIDEALISLFKKNHKPIFELNKSFDIDAIWQACMKFDAEMCSNLSMNPEDDDVVYLINQASNTLKEMAQEIKDYYQNGRAFIGKIQKMEQHFLSEDLGTEIHTAQLTKELREQVDFGIETTCQQENKAWVKLFTELHQQGIDGMLMASGYMHVLADDTSLLNLLANEGFSIVRVSAPELTLEKQFAKLAI